MFKVIGLILLFLFLFWLITSKLPNVGQFFTDLGDDLWSLVFDKNYTNEYNRSVNLFGLLASKIRQFFRWVKNKFARKQEAFTEN